MKRTFRIFDWAGNDKSDYYGTFETFEDAWDALYTEFSHLDDAELSEQLDEFYVDDAPSRPANYLDPRDPRANTKVKK